MALAVSTLQARFDKRYKEGTITAGFVALLIYHTRHYYERYIKTFNAFEDSRWELLVSVNNGNDTTAAKEHFVTMCGALEESLRKCWAMRFMTEDATLTLENPSVETLKAYAQAMADTWDENFDYEYALEDGTRDEVGGGDDPVSVLEYFGDFYEQIHDRLPPAVDWNA